MAKRGNDLAVAKTDAVAETVAATIWDLVNGATPATARDASAFRLVRKHVQELCELHDEIAPDEVLRTFQTSGNGHGTHSDPRPVLASGFDAHDS